MRLIRKQSDFPWIFWWIYRFLNFHHSIRETSLLFPSQFDLVVFLSFPSLLFPPCDPFFGRNPSNEKWRREVNCQWRSARCLASCLVSVPDLLVQSSESCCQATGNIISRVTIVFISSVPCVFSQGFLIATKSSSLAGIIRSVLRFVVITTSIVSQRITQNPACPTFLFSSWVKLSKFVLKWAHSGSCSVRKSQWNVGCVQMDLCNVCYSSRHFFCDDGTCWLGRGHPNLRSWFLLALFCWVWRTSFHWVWHTSLLALEVYERLKPKNVSFIRENSYNLCYLQQGGTICYVLLFNRHKYNA